LPSLLSKQAAGRGCFAPGRGGEIAVDVGCESMNLISLYQLGSRRRLPFVVTGGVLLVALGLGWFAESPLYRFLDGGEELTASVAAMQRKATPPIDAAAPTVASPPALSDLAAVKQAIDLVRGGKTGEATGIEKSIGDPVAQKLVEWLILRHPSGDAGFDRYAAFIGDNPSWPSIGLLRRRAEGRLWQERSDTATVRRFTDGQPASAKGRFALARVLLAEGDRDGAERQVRQAWRSEELSDHVEAGALAAFRELLTREDHRARMDRRIGAKDFSGAMRAARRLGGGEVSIVKACEGVAAKARKSMALLNAVPTKARQDLGYVLCRVQWLMRHDRVADATQLMLAASPETMALQDTNEWWRKRRTLARELLDRDNPKAAYQVVKGAATPDNPYYRADGDDSFQNNIPDPVTSGNELPTFKFELEKSEGRVMGGSYGKEATVAQLPISKGIAGVSMRMEPGVMRELHWHATAAEWAFVTEGRVRTTVIDPQGCSETNDFEPGDIWYFPRGHGHVIETLGDKPCHFVLVFDSGYFSEFGTFSITDWLGHAPKELLAKNFRLPASTFDSFPAVCGGPSSLLSTARPASTRRSPPCGMAFRFSVAPCISIAICSRTRLTACTRRSPPTIPT
jgi:oxalate decarboxylase/phosphoglucose isomerase-like protein (cupin superfamily)